MSSSSNNDAYADPFWNTMWNKGVGKGEYFDKVGASPALMKLINEGSIPNGRCLVPGCGRAYDIHALASPSRVVLGIDIAEKAVEAAREYLLEQNIPKECSVNVQLLNFFDIQPSSQEEKFDFIYDYTFLCALHPSIRTDWALQMSRLLKPGGELMTLIFPIMEKPEGPPYGVSIPLFEELLLPLGFRCDTLQMLPPELCHPNRENKSALGRWILTGPAPEEASSK